MIQIFSLEDYQLSLFRIQPWSFAIFAAVVRSDAAVVDVGAIGLLTILRVDGDASGVDENGAAFVARKGVVGVVANFWKH